MNSVIRVVSLNDKWEVFQVTEGDRGDKGAVHLTSYESKAEAQAFVDGWTLCNLNMIKDEPEESRAGSSGLKNEEYLPGIDKWVSKDTDFVVGRVVGISPTEITVSMIEKELADGEIASKLHLDELEDTATEGIGEDDVVWKTNAFCNCSLDGDPFKAPEQHAIGCPWRDGDE